MRHKTISLTEDDIEKGYVTVNGIRADISGFFFDGGRVYGETYTYVIFEVDNVSLEAVKFSKKILLSSIESCCGIHLLKWKELCDLSPTFTDLDKKFIMRSMKQRLKYNNAGLKYAFIQKGEDDTVLVCLGFKKNRKLKGDTIEYIFPTNHYSGH